MQRACRYVDGACIVELGRTPAGNRRGADAAVLGEGAGIIEGDGAATGTQSDARIVGDSERTAALVVEGRTAVTNCERAPGKRRGAGIIDDRAVVGLRRSGYVKCRSALNVHHRLIADQRVTRPIHGICDRP